MSTQTETVYIEMIPGYYNWDPERIVSVRAGRMWKHRPKVAVRGAVVKVVLTVDTEIFDPAIHASIEAPAVGSAATEVMR